MEMVFTPTDFVAAVNQTMDFAYPRVTIEGEMANVRVSRGKWVYFDIKDEYSSVKCFGTVYMLPGPIEEGLMVRVVASPRLHPLYNFSLNIQSVLPIGEGSIKRASDLLMVKLSKEGIFDESKKRPLPVVPQNIGLVTSGESAAYADFIKIVNQRWVGTKIMHCDVMVQGEQAITDIVNAIAKLNQIADSPEVIVITRGGGSVDDLAVFSSEQIVRAVAGSRIPTLVAIGHEVDISLAELAADFRASTPSNAAESLTPDKNTIKKDLSLSSKRLKDYTSNIIRTHLDSFRGVTLEFRRALEISMQMASQTLARQAELLEVLNPSSALKRGYAIIRSGRGVIGSVKQITPGDKLLIQVHDGNIKASVDEVE